MRHNSYVVEDFSFAFGSFARSAVEHFFVFLQLHMRTYNSNQAFSEGWRTAFGESVITVLFFFFWRSNALQPTTRGSGDQAS